MTPRVPDKYTAEQMINEFNQWWIEHLSVSHIEYDKGHTIYVKMYNGMTRKYQLTESGFGWFYEVLRRTGNKDKTYKTFTQAHRQMTEALRLVGLTLVGDELKQAVEFYEKSEQRMSELISLVNSIIEDKPCILHAVDGKIVGVSRKDYNDNDSNKRIIRTLENNALIPFITDFFHDFEAVNYLIKIDKYAEQNGGNIYLAIKNGFDGRTKLSATLKFVFDANDDASKTVEYDLEFESENKHLSNLNDTLRVIASKTKQMMDAKLGEILIQMNGASLGNTAFDLIHLLEFEKHGFNEKEIPKAEEIAGDFGGTDGLVAMNNIQKEYANKHGYKRVCKILTDNILRELYVEHLA